MNLPELRAYLGLGAAASLEQALGAAREKERGWAEAENGANRETLVTQATARQADFEAQLAALKAKGVPPNSPQYRGFETELRKWQQRLKLLGLLEAVDAYEAIATATAALIAEKRHCRAEVELRKLRPLLPQLPDEFGARFTDLEADFKDACPTASGTPATPTPATLGTPTLTPAPATEGTPGGLSPPSPSAHAEEAPAPDEPVDAADPKRDRGPSAVSSQDGEGAPGTSDGVSPAGAMWSDLHARTPPVGWPEQAETGLGAADPPRAEARRRHRRHRMAMAAVIGGALLAVGIGLYRGVYLPRERARQQRTSTPPFRMDANRWAWIPPGTFTMGSPAMDLDRADDEGPQTAVTLTEGFWMGKYEVTQGEYRAVVADNPSRFRDPNRPVEQVTWSDATNYCATLTAQERSAGRLPAGWAYRLPTEAEWEYAARAGTTTTLSYGNDSRYKQLEKYAWYYANSGGTTHPVGQKRPNPWGLYDMSGNVWEWCWDWFGTYLGGSLSDPTGPGSGSDRVLRGGGWLVVEQGCRSAFRVRNSPGLRNSYTGFRAVLALGTNGVPAALAGEPPFLEGAVTNVTSPSVPSTQRAGNTAAVETVTGQPGRESAPPDTPPFNMDTIRWAWMPPGTFTMGSPASEQERDRDEGPQTVVTLTKGFWMGRCEVTQGEYFAVTGSNPSYFKGDQNRPVEDVSWIEATNYCATLTAQERAAARLPTGWAYRLPTEAEWEYAARAETTTRLSYGDDPGYSQLSTHGWYSSNSGSTTHPVGEKRANPWGLYDMSGNVWEWCWDWFGTYHGGSVSNPTGPRSGSNRVVRGGSWYYVEKYCRSASRDFNTPDDRSNRIGFRAVLAAGQP